MWQDGKRVTVNIPAHGSQAYFVTGTRMERKRYQGEEAWANKYQEINGFPNARPMEAGAADQGAYMGWLGNLKGNYMEWRNVYSQGGRYKLAIRYATAENRDLQLHVNGEDQGFFNDLNSGGWDDKWSTQEVEVTMQPGYNVIRLGNPVGFAPNIDYIELTLLESAQQSAVNNIRLQQSDTSQLYDLNGRQLPANYSGIAIGDHRKHIKR